jgi:hypothetical protein
MKKQLWVIPLLLALAPWLAFFLGIIRVLVDVVVIPWSIFWLIVVYFLLVRRTQKKGS